MTRVCPRSVAEPHLRVDVPKGEATAIALVLHGGRSTSTERVTPFSLAAIRMLPFARSLQHTGSAYGLVVARLRYQQRGWNGSAQAPVRDARWALRQLAARFGDLPVGLVGHSMGGRAAMYVADDFAVRSFVGLAPWIEPGDRVDPLQGRRVMIVHGDADRTTSPRTSELFSAQLQGVAASSSYVAVHDEEHAMLHRPSLWHALAAGFTLGALVGKTLPETTDEAIANIITKALDGQPNLAI